MFDSIHNTLLHIYVHDTARFSFPYTLITLPMDHYLPCMFTCVSLRSSNTSITNTKKKEKYKKEKKMTFQHITESHLVQIKLHIYLHYSRYYDLYCDLLL